MRAAALQNTNMTDFVLRNVMTAAKEIVGAHERLVLSEKDRLQVLDILNNPPAPNEKLMAAAFALPKKP